MDATQVIWIACADDAPPADRSFGLPVYTLTGMPGLWLKSWRDGTPEYVALSGYSVRGNKAADDEPMPEAKDA